MSIQVDPLRKFLHGLAMNMVDRDVEAMKFLLGLPEAEAEKISNPLQLFKHLIKIRRSDDEIINCLREIFPAINRQDLDEEVLEYVKQQQNLKRGPLESCHHDTLVKSTSFPTQELRSAETIARCQSFQGSPQQRQTGEASVEKVHFSSAPNSPPEERNTRPEPLLLLLSDQKRSGELCSQLNTPEIPLATRSQSETRRQLADRYQSEERTQLPERGQSEGRITSTARSQSVGSSQSEDRIPSTDRGQSEVRIQSTERSQSENKIQSLNTSQSEDSKSKSSHNERENNADCAGRHSSNEQRSPTHNLGMKDQLQEASLMVPSETVDAPISVNSQTKESEDSTLTSPVDQFLPNSETETKLKELYISSSESSPSISNSLASGRNLDGNSITPEFPNTTLLTAECESEPVDVDCDGPQSTAKMPKSLVSLLSRTLMCSEIEREMIGVSSEIKANSAEHMSTSAQSPRTQNSSTRTLFSQNFSNCRGNTDRHLDSDQDRLGMAASAVADEPDSDDMRPVPQGFYGNFLKRLHFRDGPKKASETIIMRNYQKELAKPGLEGKNCIICAPTGSGKTLTAGYICQFQRMKATAERRPFKALFIVCIRNLILQQRDALSQIIVSEDGSKLVGGLGETTLLSEYMKMYDVTVLTAQILVNCLKTGEVRMSDFDLLIMDECHHTTLNHPYSTIMLEYHRSRKENPSGKLPQVIGLTASLGVGSAGDDPMGALYHYIRLCANLDCTSITHVKDQEHLDELLLFNPKPQKDQIISVEPRPTDNIFYQILDYMMTEIERITLFPLATASHSHGSQQYENWVVRQRLEAESKGLVDTILCTETLQRLNAALMLYDELRACDAKRYLDAYFAEHFASQNRRPTFVLINRLYNDMRQEMEEVMVKEKLSDNAKLHQLCTLLTDLYSTNTEARGIILTKTRLSVEILLNCIKELPELRRLVYPAKLVGQGGKEGRMTDVEQENTLRRFREGKEGGCNLLIATDVAQEGLDMPKCNFVIRYNFVSNEIGSVQSKGRARAPNSECYLIVNRNSINEKKEYENLEKEHMMLQALKDIDEISEKELEEAIRKEQERVVEENEQKMQLKKAGAQLLDAENITIHCRYCKSELCRATDIRLRLNNYICIAVDQLLTKVFIKKLDRPDEYRLDSKTGLCICNDRHCQKIIGAQLQYKQGIRKHGYVLSKQNVMWKYGNESDYRQIKKWSAVPFEIKEEMLFPTL